MKRRLLATFLSLCLLVGLLPTVALATDEEPGAESAPVCTCEALCTEGAADETCSVCAEDYTLCTYVAPDEPVCAQLDGCVNGAHAADCPLYVEPEMNVDGKEPLLQSANEEGTADKAYIDENADERTLNGSGTAEDPYLISSAADLDKIRYYVVATEIEDEEKYIHSQVIDGYFKLTGNIDMTSFGEWTPIGITESNKEVRYKTAFVGTLDGGNYTISNLTLDTAVQGIGLFTRVGEDGTVKDLTIDTCKADSDTFTAQEFGAICGTAWGGTFSNITLKNVTLSGGGYAGALTGDTGNSDTVTIVKNCSVETSSISGGAATGGLIGRTHSADKVIGCAVSDTSVSATGHSVGGLAGIAAGEISDCHTMDITVTSTSTTNAYAGGLIGQSTATLVENCSSTGTVNAGLNNIGGGLIAYTSTEYGEIKGCHTDAAVTAAQYAGGLIGQISGAEELLISDCYAEGTVTVTGDSDNSTHIGGGLIARAQGVIVENCYATGTVRSAATALKEESNDNTKALGGLIGKADDTCKISDSYATGDVISYVDAGGFIGKSNAEATIQNCYATGDVTLNALDTLTKTYEAGGFIGYAYGTIENCYATGAVSAAHVAGGFVGTPDSAATITNCAADGAVSLTGNADGAAAGGFVGKVSNGFGSGGYIHDAIALGTVSGNGSLGAFVGVAASSVAGLQNCYANSSSAIPFGGKYTGYNSPQNCFYAGSVTGISPADNKPLGTANNTPDYYSAQIDLAQTVSSQFGSDIALAYTEDKGANATGTPKLTLDIVTDPEGIITIDENGTLKAAKAGSGTMKLVLSVNGKEFVFGQTSATVTPRVLTYTLTGDDTGSGSITYNYSGGHHALANSLTFKWKDSPNTAVELVEGTDINYTYTVNDAEAPDGGEELTYDYLPMPVGNYDNVKFNLLNENYIFGLSDGSTRDYLEIDVNVVAGETERAYLASAWPKADQNFVYTGEDVLPVEGTLNAYEQDNTSSDTVDIGTFTINIEGLNGTSFNSEVSEIPAGTDLSAITDLALPTEPGTYIITASAANDDYYLYKSLVFTISKATVTIKADDKSVYVGAAMPTLTYTVSGLVGNDELSGTVSLSCEATNTNTAGTYTITPSGATVPNTEHYNSEIVYQPGTLTILSRGGGGSSSGGSSSSNVSGSGDNVSITASGGSVTVSQMESAVKKADEGATITIKATGSSNISLPASGLESAADNDNSLTLDLRYGEVTLSPEALSSVVDQAGSTVTLTVAPVDTDELNSRQQAAVGDAPVFDLTIRSGSTVISDFDGGLVTVSIPYELPSNQDPAGVVVWFMDDDGNITPCETMYDTRTETVIFTTRHFSKYVIGYEEPTVFTDVSEDAYYADAVLWAVANGVTYGTSATTFSPDMAVSRAQMVTFLWRAHGSPKATGANPFTDVSTSDYYYDAVLWAVANGVTNGTSATTFSPDMAVTRAQAVTFQWRAAGSPVVSGSSFGDVAADAYYVNAVTWAVANGITNGTGGNTFSPDVVVSRAQAVTFLWRELA